MNSSLSHSREQRFKFIEALALWEGTVQRKQVSKAFGVAQNHVTNDLRVYETKHPNNIRFDPRKRAYVPERGFKPAYISSDPSEYLALLYAHADSHSLVALAGIGGQEISAEIIPGQPHGLKTRSVQSLIKAIRSHKGVAITYNSMSSEKPTKRIIWPHSFFHTGFRWQVRAYDEHRKDFRDFVIQRMGSIRFKDILSPVAINSDEEWANFVNVTIKPNPGFNKHQRNVVANDYGMKLINGEFFWALKLRRCLFPYFAVRYNLSKKNTQKPLRQYPVVLQNYDELKNYFF